MFFSVHVFIPIYVWASSIHIYLYGQPKHILTAHVYGMDLVGFKFIHDVAC